MSLPFWTLRSLLSTYVVKKICLTSTLRTMWSLIWTGLSSSLAPAIIFILGVSVHRRPTPDTQPETDRSPASRQLKNTDLGFLEALLFHWQYLWETLFSSVQFSHSVMSDSLWPHELQHARPPCPSPTPGVYWDSCPLSQWCHPAISSSVVPFSSCPQSLPASGSFPMSQLFASGGQSTGVSALASVLPMNTQDWSPLGWTSWISLQSKGLLRVFSSTTEQKHQFFSAQLSSQSNSHIHTWPLEKPQPWLDGPLLAK